MPSVWFTTDARNTNQQLLFERVEREESPGSRAGTPASPETFEAPPALRSVWFSLRPEPPIETPYRAFRSPERASVSLDSRHNERHAVADAVDADASSTRNPPSRLESSARSPRAVDRYTDTRNKQSPTSNEGDVTFCVWIIAKKCLKFSIVHVNLPASVGSVEAPGLEPAALPIDPPRDDASDDASDVASKVDFPPLETGSITSAHRSSRTAIFACTVKQSSIKNPFFGSSTKARGAKSHQPCDFLREENLCQLSLRAPADGFEASSSPSPATGSRPALITLSS